MTVRPGHLVIALGLPALFVSCSLSNRLLKAPPAPLSSTFEKPSLAQDSRDRIPFQKFWVTPDPRVKSTANAKRKLYIAPVSLAQLRPLKKPLVRKEVDVGSIERRDGDVAAQLRSDFISAFQNSPAPRYRIVDRPGKDTLTLQLSIIELNPTSPKGNVVKTALGFLIGPLASPVGYFTKGNMAIEGKLLDSRTHQTFIQFADNEADIMTVYSLRDFRPYGHAMRSMKKWAEQFEELSRATPDQKLWDSPWLTLLPY